MSDWYRNPVKKISGLKKTLWLVVIFSLCALVILTIITLTIFPEYRIALVISVLYYILAIFGYYSFYRKETGRAPEKVLIADDYFAYKNKKEQVVKIDYSRIVSIERFNENLYVLGYGPKNGQYDKKDFLYLYWAIAEEIEDKKKNLRLKDENRG